MSAAPSPRPDLVRRCARAFDRVVSHWIRGLRAPSTVRAAAAGGGDRSREPAERRRHERDN